MLVGYFLILKIILWNLREDGNSKGNVFEWLVVYKIFLNKWIMVIFGFEFNKY